MWTWVIRTTKSFVKRFTSETGEKVSGTVGSPIYSLYPSRTGRIGLLESRYISSWSVGRNKHFPSVSRIPPYPSVSRLSRPPDRTTTLSSSPRSQCSSAVTVCLIRDTGPPNSIPKVTDGRTQPTYKSGLKILGWRVGALYPLVLFLHY